MDKELEDPIEGLKEGERFLPIICTDWREGFGSYWDIDSTLPDIEVIWEVE